MKKLKICRVATVSLVLQTLIKTTIEATVNAGHEVFLVAGPGPFLEQYAKQGRVHVYPLVIEREISWVRDIKALICLYIFFRKNRFDVVHSIMPKAGLVTAVAGFLARVPVRIHTFTGQAWQCKTGPVRWISKSCDWLICRLNTQCYADSHSQKAFLLTQGVGKDRHIRVLGDGSVAGVDTSVFDPCLYDAKKRSDIRRSLDIPDHAVVINFTGRVNVDKGIGELIEAFKCLTAQKDNLYWIVVGPFEQEKDVLPAHLIQFLHQHSKIRVVGFADDPARYYAVSDIFCLPSHREGFGGVVIEAGIMGLPTIATRIAGLMDAVVEGETGLLVPIKDSGGLAKTLLKLVDDGALRKKIGDAARKRAMAKFDQKRINQLILEEYQKLIK